jgi:hypothetical protein
MSAPATVSAAGLVLAAVLPPFLGAFFGRMAGEASIRRLTDRTTTWDVGSKGLGTKYEMMMLQMPKAIACALGTALLVFNMADGPYSLRQLNILIGTLVICGVVLTVFGYSLGFAFHAFNEWRRLEAKGPRFVEINGRHYRVMREFPDGRSAYELESYTERMGKYDNYKTRSDEIVRKAGWNAIGAGVGFVVAISLLSLGTEYILGIPPHNTALNGGMLVVSFVCIAAYPLGFYLAWKLDVTIHEGKSAYIHEGRPLGESESPPNLDKVKDDKPLGDAKFGTPTPDTPRPAKPSGKYANPFS